MSSLKPSEFTDTDRDDFFKFQVEIGARRRFGPDWADRPEVVERLNTEIGLMVEKDFTDFFLLLWMLMERCREEQIAIGPGRGSVGGSLVAYCMRITDVNPLTYDLLFERFLSPDRNEPPDIDVDFSQVHRPRVLELAREIFGEDKTFQIGAFQRFGYKEILKTICPIAGMPPEKVDELRALIPENPMGGQKTQREFARIYAEFPNVAEWLDRPEHAAWKAAILAADGGYQHMGRHAAGVLVLDAASQAYIPLASPDGETYVTAWDMYDIDRLQLLKQDILGLRTLDIIEDACRSARIKPQDIDHDAMDPATAELLAAGDTLGIFQLENWGFTQVTKELQPSEFEHVAALNALFRPGCLNAHVWAKDGRIVDMNDDFAIEGAQRLNMVDVYIERRHGRMELEYLHPDLEPILAPTQGIILYQEQAMRIAKDMAGFTGGQPDALRKAIGKKIQAKMDELEVVFNDGMEANGYPAHLAATLWENIAAASRYSWNKAHSVEYGILTYRTAYLKANHPAHFYAAVLRSLNKKESIAAYISELKLRGVPLAPPLINESVPEFIPDKTGEAVMFGLAGIAGAGQAVMEAILTERENGPFIGLQEFMVRCPGVPIHVVESLIAAGAFDNLPQDLYQGWRRGFMMANARTIKANTKLKKKQHPLEAGEFTDSEMLQKEREVLGFFITDDPMDKLREEYAHYAPTDILIGTVSGIRTKNDKNGNEMAFVQVDDPNIGRRSTTWFSSLWGHAPDVSKGAVVVLLGADETYQGRTSFKVDRLLRTL